MASLAQRFVLPGLAALAAALVGAATAAVLLQGRGAESVAQKLAGLERRPGLLPLYLDRAAGQVWLKLPPPGERGVCARLLYAESLRTGLGSGELSIDRGQLGQTRLVELRRLGRRVLVEAVNLEHRALGGDAPAEAAVRESFATSVLWGKDVAAVDSDGSSLVELSGFLTRDAHDLVARLEAEKQGTYALDPARTAVDLDQALTFPDNLELEAVLTFTGRPQGDAVRAVAPSAEAITVVQHHSFVRLPDTPMPGREAHPRAGFRTIGFLDHTAPLERSRDRRFILRHRLLKADPRAERAKAQRTIVYYVDRATPEPVRQAVIDGAGWWKKAFDAAGFDDAFRVELLPEGAHPLDARYNVIQWVHRASRGWSYGGSIYDPRTGEVLKGQVTLDAGRVRQVRALFEGLAGAAASGKGGADDPVQLALARVRQLAAHEVGHALGLAHNFAASSYGDRASVMDYPAPLVSLEGGRLDFSRAFGKGVGSWDLHAIRYGYSDFPAGTDERAALAAMVREADARGLAFASDADGRGPGASLASASPADNGDDPVKELQRALEVRALALAGFGRGRLPPDEPLAHLQELLLPVYYYPREAAAVAARLVGGFEYRHALGGEENPPARYVDGARQRAALAALLEVVKPARLDLPDALWAQLLPRPPEEPPAREGFPSATAPAFDLLAAAQGAQADVFARILEPARLARLADGRRRDERLPGVEDVLAQVASAVFDARDASPRLAELRRAGEALWVRKLIATSADPSLPHAVRYRLDGELLRLEGKLKEAGREAAEAAHRGALRQLVERHRQGHPPLPAATPPEPGPPEPRPVGEPAPL